MSEVQRALQVGDKVRIVRKAEFHHESYAFWDDEMDAFIGNGEVYVVQDEAYMGEVGTVEVGTSLEDHYRDGVNGWLWPAGSLELVEQ